MSFGRDKMAIFKSSDTDLKVQMTSLSVIAWIKADSVQYEYNIKLGASYLMG